MIEDSGDVAAARKIAALESGAARAAASMTEARSNLREPCGERWQRR